MRRCRTRWEEGEEGEDPGGRKVRRRRIQVGMKRRQRTEEPLCVMMLMRAGVKQVRVLVPTQWMREGCR